MNISSHSSQTLVVDANVAVWAVVPVVAQISTIDILEYWHSQSYQIIAPDIWVAKAVSVIRFITYKKLLSPQEGKHAIDDLFALEIQAIPINRLICQAAYSWASKLQHARAYDSLYLALAEAKNAWLWTADKRLVNGARQHGFSQIGLIGEDAAVDFIEKSEETHSSET